MPVDEMLINKSSEDVTGEDVRELLNAPSNKERTLIEPGVFDEKQPAPPIYKSIPLKFALAGVVALAMIVPAISLFSGNLLTGTKPTQAESSDKEDATETEEEKSQALLAEENADLKRKLALQNQSFTAQEIENKAKIENSAATKPTQVANATTPSPPQPVSRPVSAVASRSAPARPLPVRIASPARAIPSSRTKTAVSAPPPSQRTVNLSDIEAAGNYGQLPSRSLTVPVGAQAIAPVVSAANNPSFVTVAHRENVLARAGAIPISVRAQKSPAATEIALETSRSTRRPVPMVMQDVSPTPKSSKATPKKETELKDAESYEAQRDFIMEETEPLRNASSLVILPGSAAELEVTTAITWASDLQGALGSVTLVSPLLSDGVEILSKGTELIVQIGELSTSGAVSLEVVAMVLPGNAAIAEVNIPADVFAILGVDGGYPVASAAQSAEQQLQAIDRQQALLGAMSAAGDYLNRPERETNVFTLGGSSSSRENGNGSLVGSLLSGAAHEMLSSRAARLNTEAEKLKDRPTTWSIEAGRQLQLFVTQEVAL